MKRPGPLEALFALAVLSFVAVVSYVWYNVEYYRNAAIMQQNELRRLNTQVDERRAQLLIVQDALVANNDFFETFIAPIQARCEEHGATTAQWQDCAASGGYWAAFLRPYNEAVFARATTTDYRATENAYRALIPLFKHSNVRADWQSRVYEGIAYMELKQGKIGPAAADAALAAKLDPTYALAGSTALKVNCIRQVPAERIRSQFRDVTDHLAQEVRRVAGNKAAIIAQRNAALEEAHLREDQELYNICDYAGIAPP